jgi:hypothetical protein
MFLLAASDVVWAPGGLSFVHHTFSEVFDQIVADLALQPLRTRYSDIIIVSNPSKINIGSAIVRHSMVELLHIPIRYTGTRMAHTPSAASPNPMTIQDSDRLVKISIKANNTTMEPTTISASAV